MPIAKWMFFVFLLVTCRVNATCTINDSLQGPFVNHLNNSDFELGFLGTQTAYEVAANWNILPVTGNYAVNFNDDTNTTHAGEHSQKIYNITDRLQMSQNGIDLFSNNKYRINFWLNWEVGSSPTNEVEVKIKKKISGVWQTLISFYKNNDLAINQWVQYSAESIFTGNDLNDASIFIIIKGQGSVYIDEIEFFDLHKPRIVDDVFVDSLRESDADDGCTENSAWKTLGKLRQYDVLPGVSVKFKRGGLWEVWNKFNDTPNPIPIFSGVENAPVTYTSYGSANEPEPVFVGSVSLDSTSDWHDLGNNRWQTNYYFNKGERGGYPDFILFNEESQSNVGVRVNGLADLDQDREYFVDVSFKANTDAEPVTVYALQNPATYYSSIKVVYAYTALPIKYKKFVTITDLAFKYTKLYNVFIESSQHILLDGLEVHFGGANVKELDSSGSTVRAARSGAGIYVKGNSRDVKIINNNISQTLDQGIGIELSGDNIETMSGIIIENNRVQLCGGGIGVKAQDAVASVVDNVLIKGNYLSNLGLGWSGTDNAVHGKGITLKQELPGAEGIYPTVKVVIEKNIIDTFTYAGIFSWNSEFIISGNIIRNGTGGYQSTYINNSGETIVIIPSSGVVISGNVASSGYTQGQAIGLISSNIIYDVEGSEMYVIRNTPSPSQGYLKIFNNVLFDESMDSHTNFETRESMNIAFKNNILYSNNSLNIKTGVFSNDAPVLDNNLYFRRDASAAAATWQWNEVDYFTFNGYKNSASLAGNDLNSKSSDPLFLDVRNKLFFTSYISEANNSGVDLQQDFNAANNFSLKTGLYPTLRSPDINDYVSQNNFGGWDIGAYVFVADIDGDTVDNEIEIASGTDPLNSDSDGDLVNDGIDIFPLDIAEWADSDADGVGDNADAYPYDPDRQLGDGDINGDGEVNIVDILLATQFTLGLKGPLANELLRGDVAPMNNGIPDPDGSINLADLLLIQRMVLRLSGY